MKKFEAYKLRCCKTCATDVYIRMCDVCFAIREREIGWKAAMKQVLLWGDDTLFNKIKDEIYGE
jgi:hypothetical protein